MKISKTQYEKYILVCENQRTDGSKCCGNQGAAIRELLKQTIKERGLAQKIRVSKSGCLDLCGQGPSVLLTPDLCWFQEVTPNDVERIIQQASQTT
jgi:(2Fe-2S) ferredoxin